MTDKTAPSETKIIAFKGFDENFQCRGYQFAVGGTYRHEGKVSACESGFHSCENPFDVWSYYGPYNSRFAEVEVSGEISRHDDDSKIASAIITIKAELSLPQFIKRAVDWLINDISAETADDDGDLWEKIGSSGDGARIGSSGYGARIGSSGNYARIGSSGDGARIGSSGDGARIGSSGYGAKIASSGDEAQIGSSGFHAQIGSSGDGARIGSSGYGAKIASSGDGARIGSSGYGTKIASSGDEARIGSSGYGAKIASSGDEARIGSSGNRARIEANGERAVIASAGANARVKGRSGSWVALAEFDNDGNCLGFATGCAGRDGVPADVWLVAKGGKLVADE